MSKSFTISEKDVLRARRIINKYKKCMAKGDRVISEYHNAVLTCNDLVWDMIYEDDCIAGEITACGVPLIVFNKIPLYLGIFYNEDSGLNLTKLHEWEEKLDIVDIKPERVEHVERRRRIM